MAKKSASFQDLGDLADGAVDTERGEPPSHGELSLDKGSVLEFKPLPNAIRFEKV